jgi:prophage regulatory protein
VVNVTGEEQVMASQKLSRTQIVPLMVSRERAAQMLAEIGERTLDALVASGQLPPPRKISKGRVGWLWRDLAAFVESRPVSDLMPGPGRRPTPADHSAAQHGSPARNFVDPVPIAGNRVR